MPDAEEEEDMAMELDDDLELLLSGVDAGPSPTPAAAPSQLEVTVVDWDESPLSADEFSRRFRHREPVLLRGLARSWPALEQWRHSDALGSALDADVTCLRSHDGKRFLAADCEQSQRPFDTVAAEILTQSCASEMYARAPLRSGLRDAVDLRVIEELMGGVNAKAACCSVWLGLAGNITPFHYDLCHGFLAGVVGSKVFTLVSPDAWRSMYPRPDRPELSRVDYEAAREGEKSEARREELRRRPKFFDESATRCLCRVEVRPGDVLYTPPFWWHHVETAKDGPAVSVLVPFDPRADEPTHVCHLR